MLPLSHTTLNLSFPISYIFYFDIHWHITYRPDNIKTIPIPFALGTIGNASKVENNIFCLCLLGAIDCFIALDWVYVLIIANMSNLHASKWVNTLHAHRRESKNPVNYSYYIFSTNNVPNRAQQRENKHNCYSLNNICHCTASAVLLGGYCTIFTYYLLCKAVQEWGGLDSAPHSATDFRWGLE